MSTPDVRQLEMARAALGCAVLTDAIRLAAWVGPGRELTVSGVLRPAVAAQACQALGIPLAATRLRSAKDVPELHRAWESALAADLVRTAGTQASAAPGAAALAAVADRVGAAPGAAPLDSEQAGQVVLAWLRAVRGQFGFPGDVCGECMATLIELHQAQGPAAITDVVAAALADGGDNGDDGEPESWGYYLCPDCGQLHESLPPGADRGLRDDDVTEHVLDTIEVLTAFGAASTGPGREPGGTVTLTPLGRLLADSVLDSLSPAQAEPAAVLVEVVADYPPRLAAAASAPWTAARTPAAAARELLDFAAGFDGPLLRTVARALARDLGPGALPAWRELAARPGFGAYARQYLSELGEEVEADARDEAWLLADLLSEAAGDVPELGGLVIVGAFGVPDGGVPPELLDALDTCGHPQAARVAAILAPRSSSRRQRRRLPQVAALPAPGEAGQAGQADKADKAGGKLYQLLITLKYVADPAVWRRVVVPAGITLGALHDVIQDAMGWEDDHLHWFVKGKITYGVPDGEFVEDDQDEDAVRLSDVLSRKGQKLAYTYDFGDEWDHVVQLEKALLPGSAEAAAVGQLPACLAGEGACPPEDCGGAWGYASLKEALADPDHEEHWDRLEWLGLDEPSEFDPAAFDLAEVNHRLR